MVDHFLSALAVDFRQVGGVQVTLPPLEGTAEEHISWAFLFLVSAYC